MKIIKQSYFIIDGLSLHTQQEFIERCGRIAYKSEDKMTEGSDEKFVRMICARGHESVLEHSHLSVLFITDRGITHELVRHRLASFTQESTRYCNYSQDKFGNELTFIKPEGVGSEEFTDDIVLDADSSFLNASEFSWIYTLRVIEAQYLAMINIGTSPQFARSILPNCLKTEIVVTANFREWRHIFKLRALDKGAHPQMRSLMIPLYKECKNYLPAVFDMGDPE